MYALPLPPRLLHGSQVHCREFPGSSPILHSPRPPCMTRPDGIVCKHVDQGIRYGRVAEVRMTALTFLLTKVGEEATLVS